jgi:hypothetical protein
MNQEEARQMAETEWWEYATAEEVVSFQLYEEMLCCPFGVFHKAMEEVLGRPVFTHEFAYSEHLIAEVEGKVPTRTFEDIIELIPPEKRIIVKL